MIRIFSWSLTASLLVVLVAAFIATGNSSATSRQGSTPEGSLAHAIAFREGFGLRSDVPYVSRMEADPSANRTLGVALTDAEFRDIDGRQTRIQAIIVPLTEALQADPTFAGLYINQKAQGRLEIRGTSRDPHHFDPILAHYSSAGGQFRVLDADYSQAELEKLQGLVADDIPVWLAQGVRIASVGIDVTTNRLAISVADLTDATEAAMIAKYGNAVSVRLGQLFSANVAICTYGVDCPTPASN
jgi:hypothetical protein